MQVSQRSKALVNIELDEEHGNWLLHLTIMLKNSVNGLWHVVHDHIQVNFILLFSLSVKRVSERDHVRVEEFTHDLQFPILVSLILVNFLDCDDFPGLRN